MYGQDHTKRPFRRPSSGVAVGDTWWDYIFFSLDQIGNDEVLRRLAQLDRAHDLETGKLLHQVLLGGVSGATPLPASNTHSGF